MQGGTDKKPPTAAATSYAPARCVLWHAPGAPAPANLLASLQKRHLEVIDCTDPFAATAQLCLLQRRAAARGARAAAAAPFILLIVFPASLPDAVDVVRAAERYAPGAVCWLYEIGPEGEANPTLRRIVPEDVQTWANRPSPAAPPASRAAPRLQLTPAHEAPAPAAAAPVAPAPAVADKPTPPTPAARSRPIELPAPTPAPRSRPTESAARAPEHRSRDHPILTNEELAMLLADDVHPGGGSGGRAAPATPPSPRQRSSRHPPGGGGPRP